MARNLILVDSNIIVYAINSASPKHVKAQMFLRSNLPVLCIAQQNILEAFRVLTHSKFANPMLPGDALQSILAISDNCRLLIPNRTSYHLVIELINKYDIKEDKVFDAYLVATALSNDIKMIATDNTKDFDKITEINTLNPFVN